MNENTKIKSPNGRNRKPRETFQREMSYTKMYVWAVTDRPIVAYGEIESGKTVAAYEKRTVGEKWR